MIRTTTRAAAVVAGLLVLTGGCSSGADPAGAPEDPPEPSASPAAASASPTEDPILDTAPGKRWATTWAGKFRGAPFRSSNDWVLTACESDGDACSGTGRSDSGKAFAYTWDGTVLTVRYRRSAIVEECIETATGEIREGSKYRRVDTAPPVKLRPVGWDGESAPTRLAGRFVIHATATNISGCDGITGATQQGTMTIRAH
jgi:hypothetical protein